MNKNALNPGSFVPVDCKVELAVAAGRAHTVVAIRNTAPLLLAAGIDKAGLRVQVAIRCFW